PGTYQLIGRTRDDAAGEAFDKVARLLGLGYPGGPIVDRLAKTGDDRAVTLPRPKFTHADRNASPVDPNAPSRAGSPRHLGDFSFSGLKTAVVRLLDTMGASPGKGLQLGAESRVLSEQQVADICATFQRVVVETLVDRTFEAAAWLGAASVGISGGVSANSRLRRDAVLRGERDGLPVFVPPISLSTDNAAMIAAAGLRKLERGVTSTLDFNADAALPIS
ncbi:MAG: tRNA (adenosine(37)-N6)-threonylcarbamoyltransferase complex transferase subunit TsaD, partial [Acidobacteriota bacterium]